MNTKTTTILLLITLLTLTTITSIHALDTTKNTTIEMNGIKIAVPETDQGKITNASSPDGIWTYTYTDDKNKIVIYVSDANMPEYQMYKEQWNEYDGYTQMRPVKDKYVMVGSEYEENKNFMYDSLKELNPE